MCGFCGRTLQHHQLGQREPKVGLGPEVDSLKNLAQRNFINVKVVASIGFATGWVIFSISDRYCVSKEDIKQKTP